MAGVKWKRSDIAVAALSGDYGKPRPVVIVQSNLFSEHPSVTILPITSDLRKIPNVRIAVEPTEANGLFTASEIMVDKPISIPVEKLREIVGRLDMKTMTEVERALMVFLGFA